MSVKETCKHILNNITVEINWNRWSVLRDIRYFWNTWKNCLLASSHGECSKIIPWATGSDLQKRMGTISILKIAPLPWFTLIVSLWQLLIKLYPHQYLLFPKLHLNLLPGDEQTASHEPHPPPISFMKVTKHISVVSINVILSCALITSAKDFPCHSCDNNSVSMNFFVNSMSMNLQNIILIPCCSQ